MAGRRTDDAARSWQRLLSLDAGDDHPGSKGLRFLVVGGALLVAFAVLWMVVRGDSDARRGTLVIDDPEAAGFGPGARTFSLYFMDDDGDPIEESREVTAQRRRVDGLRVLVEELLGGSLEGHARALPEGTRLRNLFSDDGGVVYVDLTKDAVRAQTGTAAEEFAGLACLVRTILHNYPEYLGVQVLIDGQPATTLGGHYAIDRPLMRGEWTGS